VADLRCPMCSKLNPDTLDVCQFCGARLRPLVLPPTSALDLPSDWKKPAPPPAPAPEPEPKPAAGKEADDWLGSLRSGTSSFESTPEEPAADSGAAPSVDDWLAKLRAQDETQEAEEEAPQPATEEPAPAQSPEGGDWLGSLRASSAEPDWLSSPVESESQNGEDVNWLQSFGPTDETLIGAVRAPTQPEPPAADSELPEWLRPPSSTDETLVGAVGEPPAAEEPPLPSWLESPVIKKATGPFDKKIPTPIEAPVEPPPPAEPQPKAVLGMTDWLASAESQATPESLDWLTSPPPDEGQKPVVGATDWLQSPESESLPRAELPEWLKPPPSEEGQKPVVGVTSWLASTESAPPPPAPPDAEGKAVIGTTDWLASFQPDSSTPPAKKTGATGWLSSQPPVSTGSTGTLKPSGKSVLGAADWLNSLAASEPAPDAPPAFDAQDFDQAMKSGEPDWVIGNDEDLPDWMKQSPPPAEPTPPETPSASPSARAVVGTTDWLKNFGKVSDEPTPAFDMAAVTGELRETDSSDLDWLASLDKPIEAAAPTRPPIGPLPQPTAAETGPLPPGGEGIENADLPPWLAAMRPTGLDITGAAPLPEAPAIASADLPDWVKPPSGVSTATSISPDETLPGAPSFPSAPSAPLPSAAAFTEAPAGEDITQAVVPLWLRQMRPPDSQAAILALEPEREETAGPLAGMRGILPAESVIAVAGKPGSAVAQFLISDAQERRAEMLRAIIQEETAEPAEIRPRKRARIHYSFGRLIVALMLIAVAILPLLPPVAAYLPIGLFPFPELSSGGRPLFQTIEALPSDQPPLALIAFEYEPAYTGELNPIIESVLAHLMKRGARIAAVSTYPTGALIAQNVMDRVAAESGVAEGYGKSYINLGYIPGGATGLQHFATAPTATILRDFSGGEKPFEREALTGFTGLENFDLIIVVSASHDDAQRWIGQVKREGQPMSAITSAAAEPLVAPFTGGDTPPITGLVSGLAGAIGYDRATGRASESAAQAAIRWNSFAISLHASAAILVGGALLSVFALIGQRRTAAQPAAPLASPAPVSPTVRRRATKTGAAKIARPKARKK